MKTAFTLLFISFFILTGCGKGPDATPLTAEEQVVKFLTAEGNRLWHLKAIYLNDKLQTLTADQLTYTMTFTLTPGEKLKGTFTNNDIKGTWKVVNGSTFNLDFYTAAGVPVHLPCDVLTLTENKLDFSYIPSSNPLVKTEEVYYAY